jgi:hypothetical protein
MPMPSKWSRSLMFPHQNSVCTYLPHTCYIPAHLTLLDFINRIIFCEKYES